MNESVCLFWGGWRSNKKGGNGVPPPSQSDKKLTICPVPRIALAVPGINCVFRRVLPEGLDGTIWGPYYGPTTKLKPSICFNSYQTYVVRNVKEHGGKIRNGRGGNINLDALAEI